MPPRAVLWRPHRRASSEPGGQSRPPGQRRRGPSLHRRQRYERRRSAPARRGHAHWRGSPGQVAHRCGALPSTESAWFMRQGAATRVKISHIWSDWKVRWLVANPWCLRASGRSSEAQRFLLAHQPHPMRQARNRTSPTGGRASFLLARIFHAAAAEHDHRCWWRVGA